MSEHGLSPAASNPVWPWTTLMLVVHTVFCLLGLALSYPLLVMLVMGAAAFSEAPAWGALVLYSSLPLPVVLLAALIGAWLARKRLRLAIAFVALPWIYGIYLIVAVALAFAFADNGTH